MTQKNDIFVRAYTVLANDNAEERRKAHATIDDKWPSYALIFDTETRTTADQSLTFGVFRSCELKDHKYRVSREGLFYADDLPAKDRKLLENYRRTAVSDVKLFPPEFPLYSRADFLRKVFWPAIKRSGALICGLNLPFDLSRLALAWNRGDKDEWSLIMAQFPNGVENRYYPRILITPIDSKKAFIKLASPWKPEEWEHNAKLHPLDLRTLAWSLFNRSYSLKRLCEELKTENQKIDHEPTGKVTIEEIEYARQDGRCTVDALNALKEEFDKHPIPLNPCNAYSPASVAKNYLDAMGIARPAEKFKIAPKYQGIAMQTYYGGRSETRIRCTEVPVVPVDFTSEYPTCCALLNLFDILTAERIEFEDDTKNIRKLIESVSLDRCFDPALWKEFRFFALIQPDDDILPVRTVYDGVTQNIGNNYLTSKTPLWFAGCDVIASAIRTGKSPRIISAVRIVPHGKQTGMKTVPLRGSMVEIDPYKDDLFRKVIEQRKLNKSNKKLYYWLKILANSIYGFFVELIPELQNRNAQLRVFSGGKNFSDSSDVIEKEGKWFFAPLASLITSAGRLLLAMTEACVSEKKGTYLFCDTDSLAIVSSENGGSLNIPGSDGLRILKWKEVSEIASRFSSLNPYDRKAVKGSILNLVDANFVDSDPAKPQRQLYGYSIAAKRYALYEKTGVSDITIVDPKAHGIGFLYPPTNSPKNWDKEVPQWIYELWDYIVRGSLNLPRKAPSWLDVPRMMRLTITTYNILEMLGEWEIARPYNFLLLPMVDPLYGFAFDRKANDKVLLVCPFSSKQKEWLSLECVNVHDGKKYKMLDCGKTNGNIPYNVVFPSQFAHLLNQYQRHPEAKSLSPDGDPCSAETKGLLKRAHVIAGEVRYVGKETDRKWEEGEEISLLEFAATEYGRKGKVIATDEIKAAIASIGINKCARESGFDRRNFIRKLVRDMPVKRNSYNEFLRWLQTYKAHRYEAAKVSARKHYESAP
jgi:hypothetical protein